MFASRVAGAGWGGGWLTLKAAEVSLGPVWAQWDHPEPGLTPGETQIEREETPHRLLVSGKIFVPRGWSWVCVCGHYTLAVLPPFATTHIHSSHLCRMSACPSLSTQTHSQTTQARGEPREGHFMLPDSPVRPQWRPSNTRAATITHKACVCVCMHPCASRSVGPSFLSDKSVWTKQRLFFLYSASHRLQHILLGSFTLTTPVQHHTLHICYLATSYVLARRPAAVITPLLPPAPPLSLLIFIGLFCVDRSRIGG